MFYIPYTKSIIGPSDYKLGPTHPSGPIFQLQYDGGIQLNLYIPRSSDMRPPTFNIGDKVNTISTQKHATVVDIPLNNSLFYTIKYDEDDKSNYDKIQQDDLQLLQLLLLPQISMYVINIPG